MQFLYPGFLWALVCLAIPVVIHLFNFRRFKTVYFSNIRFLKEVKEETSSRSRLKHLLVLAARMLALAFLVFAFAQPFVPKQTGLSDGGTRYVSIYMDNSFSMNAVQNGQRLLDKARQTAAAVARSYADEDRFQLLTNDFAGKHQRLMSREEFLTAVEEVDISPASRTLAEVCKRQPDVLAMSPGGRRFSVLISDFQQNTGSFQPDSFTTYSLIALGGSDVPNVFIDSCWFLEPLLLAQQQANLIVKISNGSAQDVTGSRLALKVNGQTKTMSELSIPAGSFVLDTMRFTATEPGWNKAELALSDFPITFDDTYYGAFQVLEELRVVVVTPGRLNPYLDALFKAAPGIRYQVITPDAMTSELLKGAHMLIADNLKTVDAPQISLMNSYVSEGGVLSVFPSGEVDIEAYNRLLQAFKANPIAGLSDQRQPLGTINLQQSVFKDVFEKIPENMGLPEVFKYYTFSRSAATAEDPLLLLKDGNAVWSKYDYLRGKVFVSGVPLSKDFSEIPVHAIFVPLIYRMALAGVQASPFGYFIGDKTRIETDLPTAVADPVFKVSGAGVEFIPQQFNVGNKMLLGLGDQVKKSGFYNVKSERSDTALVVALNYNRTESQLKFFDADDLRQMYAQSNVSVADGARAEASVLVRQLDRGAAYWKYCLLLVLFFLAAETALIRLWKQ